MSMWPAGCAATRGGSRTFLIDYRAAPEYSQLNTTASGDDHTDKFACGRILGQGRLTHAMKYFEAPRLLALFAGDGFVGVGRHCSISVFRCPALFGRASDVGLIMAEI
jgi:hypothetical protein